MSLYHDNYKLKELKKITFLHLCFFSKIIINSTHVCKPHILVHVYKKHSKINIQVLLSLKQSDHSILQQSAAAHS